MKFTFESIIAFLGTLVTTVFGGITIPFITLLWFILFDMVSGLIKAVYNKDLSSATMSKGLIKKGFMLLVIAVSFRLGILANDTSFIILNMVCLFYIACEGLSILENASSFIELPEFLTKFLRTLKDNNDKGESNGQIKSNK